MWIISRFSSRMRVRNLRQITYYLPTLLRTVSLFSTIDGQCFASLLVSDPATLAPPKGAEHGESIIKDSWKWTRLSAGIIGDVGMPPRV